FYGQRAADAGSPVRLRILLVEDDHQPIGILPLVVMTERSRLGSMRILGYPLAGWGSFYGPIGPRPAETLAAGLDHIQQTTRDWDLLDLRWVDAEIDAGETPRAMQVAGFSADRQIWHESAQIELSRGWDAYWNARKSHWRSNVRRCRRLLERRGSVEYIRYRPSVTKLPETQTLQNDARWDLYDACVELADRSWQGSSTSGTTMSHESIRDYLRATHSAAIEAGAADMNLLVVNDQPVAFAYNYHYRGSVFGLRSGYHPDFAHEGPGNVLMAMMIEDSCRRGDRLIDLGPNYLDCKRHWFTRLQPAWHYTYFNPLKPRAQGLRLKRAIKRWLRMAGTPRMNATGAQRDVKSSESEAKNVSTNSTF
ncbi:MAG TPA: GNAT family N-acetyltransferase, partial [Pirellulales bacterium]